MVKNKKVKKMKSVKICILCHLLVKNGTTNKDENLWSLLLF